MKGPNPADYGLVEGDREFLGELGDPNDYRNARLSKRIYQHSRGREIVQLPKEDEQLGSRWVHVLSPDQTMAAKQRGMLRELLAGNDLDDDRRR